VLVLNRRVETDIKMRAHRAELGCEDVGPMWDTSRLLSAVGSFEPLGSVNGGAFDQLNNCQHLVNGFSAFFVCLSVCSGSLRGLENRKGSRCSTCRYLHCF